MGKICECAKCINRMVWSLPATVRKENYEYAKYCVRIARTTFVCAQTMKIKKIEHTQQCKYFINDTEQQEEIQIDYIEEIKALEQKIAVYEQHIAEAT